MTKIADFPPGLMSRRMIPIDQGRVVVEERWNIDVPGCPLIKSPWHPFEGGPEIIRQVVMTEREYLDSGISISEQQ